MGEAEGGRISHRDEELLRSPERSILRSTEKEKDKGERWEAPRVGPASATAMRTRAEEERAHENQVPRPIGREKLRQTPTAMLSPRDLVWGKRSPTWDPVSALPWPSHACPTVFGKSSSAAVNA